MGRVVHFEIHCDDLDRAERFYTDVFGWRIDRWEGAPIDDRLVNTIQVETQRRVEAAGGTQVVEPDTVPGVGTVAYFKDTEGNILGALEPAEPFAAAGWITPRRAARPGRRSGGACAS